MTSVSAWARQPVPEASVSTLPAVSSVAVQSPAPSWTPLVGSVFPLRLGPAGLRSLRALTSLSARTVCPASASGLSAAAPWDEPGAAPVLSAQPRTATVRAGWQKQMGRLAKISMSAGLIPTSVRAGSVSTRREASRVTVQMG